MARISGINLPLNKRAVIGLTYIHGIGRSTAEKIVETTGVDPDTRVGDLTDDEVMKLREAVEEFQVEGDLRRERSQNIKRLMEIGSYRGLVTVAACRSAVSAPRPMPAAARARGG